MSKDFKDFLLKEYSHIVQAHFKSIETISAFFRYYLLIMSAIILVPYTIAGKLELTELVMNNIYLISIILFLISMIGVGVFCYVLNLRLDAILYARAVNGIRKFFYDTSDIDIIYKLSMRTLPQSPSLPHYFEKSYFLPVVFVFLIINTFYANLALYTLSTVFYVNNAIDFVYISLQVFWGLTLVVSTIFLICRRISIPLLLLLIIVTCTSFIPLPTISGTYWVSQYDIYRIMIFFICALILIILHLKIYTLYAHHRETEYLRSNIIGVDIDGVLNEHRKPFCDFLFKKTKKNIAPSDINVYPVHEHPTLNVHEDEARAVFNEPQYWYSMLGDLTASYYLNKLRNMFRLKVHIFTYRAWPDIRRKEKIPSLIKNFLKYCQCVTLRKVIFHLIIHIPVIKHLLVYFKEEPLKQITTEWLAKNNIKYDKFLFERGNDSTSDPIGEFRNRMFMAKKNKIKFFVEDDVEKAKKLSYICDIVFLVSHPYNEPDDKISHYLNELRRNLPTNIIRVDNWLEIFQHIRRLI